MKAVLLKDVKKGEYFTLKPIEYPSESRVFVRDEYDRETKKFGCYKWSDVNQYTEKKGTTTVYIDFIF